MCGVFLLQFLVNYSLSLLQNLDKIKTSLLLTTHGIVSHNWMQCTKLYQTAKQIWETLWTLEFSLEWTLKYFTFLSFLKLSFTWYFYFHLVNILLFYGKKSVSTLKHHNFFFCVLKKKKSKWFGQTGRWVNLLFNISFKND